MLTRKGNFILNKLSVTLFEKLSNEFMSLGFDERIALMKIVSIIIPWVVCVFSNISLAILRNLG